MKTNNCFILLLISTLFTLPVSAGSVSVVVQTFHEAIKNGKADAARRLLEDNVLIFESGGVERSAEEYSSHHLHADIAFLSGMNTKILEHDVEVHGDVAISASRTKITGTFKDKQYDNVVLETMVLKKNADGWKISHIHWSN